MKKIIAMLLALVMVLSLAACGGSNATEPTKAPEAPATPATPETPAEPENPLAGSYDITMWVSESDGMTALTQEMIDAFEVAYPVSSSTLPSKAFPKLTLAQRLSLTLLPLPTSTASHRTSWLVWCRLLLWQAPQATLLN